ncbi:MAG: 4-oxalocrotonate tautomerase [Spirulina sp. SIO3F2]|nr:4-oxalocrotonate tautomerase [Spirulina sp. SIO3F2]
MTKTIQTFLSLGVVLLTLNPIVACSPAADSGGEQAESAINQSVTEQWQAAGTIPLSVESHQTVVVGDFVYLLGGWNSRTYAHDEVFFTRLSAEGTLTDWQEATAPMPLKLQHHQASAHAGSIYVIGGDDQFGPKSNVSDRIFRAVPDSEGDIPDWEEVGRLPAPRTIHAVTIVRDRLYVIGGSREFHKGAVMADTVFAAVIATDGSVGEFEELNPFPTPISWLTATAVDDRIVAISGKVGWDAPLTNQVWLAAVTEDGSLSGFEPIGETVARQRHTTVLIDGRLILIAGGARRVLSRVEAATVEADGSLSDWQMLPPLPAARYAHAAFVHGGSVYVSGGFVKYGSGETSNKIFRLDLEK